MIFFVIKKLDIKYTGFWSFALFPKMTTSWKFNIDVDFYMQKVGATPQVQFLVRKIS